jgi:hypothetical protein
LLVEQRRDDAAQVAAGGVLRLGRPASGHGRDDRQVLGERELRTPGLQRQLELVADELAVQPFEQAGDPALFPSI